MAAIVKVRRWTGADGSPAQADITSINTRANAQDVHSVDDTSNPVQIPEAGSGYSFWVSTRLYVEVAPVGTINNIKWFTDGSNNLGAGITCVGQEASAYKQATGTVGETGDQLTAAAHGSLVGGEPTNLFAFTSAAPKAITGSITATTGDVGNFLVYQMVVDASALAGISGAEMFTWKYDES